MAHQRGYGQFCPLAKAAEILGERWMLLIVRELVGGSRRFGELRRGIPLISPGMLAQRLRELEEARVIVRRTGRPRPGAAGAVTYELAPAGEELRPIVEQIATWGRRWSLAELRRGDLEPAFAMWAVHRTVRLGALGPDRVVIAFQLLDAPQSKRHWWLVSEGGGVELCLTNPGLAVDLTVMTRVRPLALLSLGELAPDAAIRSGQVALRGAPALARGFRAWWPPAPPLPDAKRGAGALTA